VFQAGLGERDVGAGRVHGDQEYAGKKTSDVLVDFGPDLVLAEVVSTRLPLGVRAEADDAVLTEYLERTILGKLAQLDRVTTDLLDGRARIPGVDMATVQRIWPILISVGEVIESEALWSFISREAADLFAQAPAQQLTLLGVEEAETLAAMVAAGDDMVGLLKEKGSGAYRELSWGRWITDTRPTPGRLPVLEERWQALSAEAVRILQIDG
jgi:hypothetical protein